MEEQGAINSNEAAEPKNVISQLNKIKIYNIF
jgi:hypothetical protein